MPSNVHFWTLFDCRCCKCRHKSPVCAAGAYGSRFGGRTIILPKISQEKMEYVKDTEETKDSTFIGVPCQ